MKLKSLTVIFVYVLYLIKANSEKNIFSSLVLLKYLPSIGEIDSKELKSEEKLFIIIFNQITIKLNYIISY